MTPNRSSDSCTTILVGKDASYDGSTIVARTEDSQNGVFTPKKFIVCSARGSTPSLSVGPISFWR